MKIVKRNYQNGDEEEISIERMLQLHREIYTDAGNREINQMKSVLCFVVQYLVQKDSEFVEELFKILMKKGLS